MAGFDFSSLDGGVGLVLLGLPAAALAVTLITLVADAPLRFFAPRWACRGAGAGVGGSRARKGLVIRATPLRPPGADIQPPRS